MDDIVCSCSAYIWQAVIIDFESLHDKFFSLSNSSLPLWPAFCLEVVIIVIMALQICNKLTISQTSRNHHHHPSSLTNNSEAIRQLFSLFERVAKASTSYARLLCIRITWGEEEHTLQFFLLFLWPYQLGLWCRKTHKINNRLPDLALVCTSSYHLKKICILLNPHLSSHLSTCYSF